MPLFAALFLLSWQLLLPHFIGVANNGDFPKVAGPFSLGTADSGAFLYFEPNYIRDARFYWDPGLPASERAIAWLAVAAERRLSNPDRFDIRWLGAVHMLGWMCGYFLLLRILRPLRGVAWWIAAAVSLWIFMDVAYVSQFNSFYTDAAALLGAMAAMAACWLIFARGREVQWDIVMMFGCTMLLYVTSKGQHGALGLIPVALLLWVIRTANRTSTRVAAIAMAVALIGGTVWVTVETPGWYRAQSRFNLIFSRILTESASPAADARELGLADSDLKYVGMHSFMAGSPVQDSEWSRAFEHRGSYASVARFYLRHPAIPLRFLWQDLHIQAFQIRAENLSNFQRKEGKPAGARTNRIATWSDLRSWWLVHAPSLLAIWYALLLVALPVFSRRDSSLNGAIVFAALMGLVEFCLASLTDCLETYRHLLLFHLFTDFTFFFALVWGLQKIRRSYWSSSTGARRNNS